MTLDLNAFLKKTGEKSVQELDSKTNESLELIERVRQRASALKECLGSPASPISIVAILKDNPCLLKCDTRYKTTITTMT